MNYNPYFNPFKKSHVVLMQLLEKELVNDTDEIVVSKFGNRTEHVFRNGKYYMTLNWALV